MKKKTATPKVPGADLGQAMPSITKDKSTAPDDYETKGHLQDLIRAHEIMNDPVKMKAVHSLAGRHDKAIKSIQDIKNYAQATYGPKGPGASKSGSLANLKGEPNDAEESESF
jgi:hypothetical protein